MTLKRSSVGVSAVNNSQKSHMQATARKTIPLIWPFAIWGLDRVGPLATIPGIFKFLLVTTNKLTKGVGTKTVMNVEAYTKIKFISSITHRLGVPQNITTDNGTDFTIDTFKEFFQNWRSQID